MVVLQNGRLQSTIQLQLDSKFNCASPFRSSEESLERLPKRKSIHWILSPGYYSLDTIQHSARTEISIKPTQGNLSSCQIDSGKIQSGEFNQSR